MRHPKLLIYVRAISGGAGKNAVKYANFLAEAGFEVMLTCARAPLVDQFGLDARVALRVLGGRKSLTITRALRRQLAAFAPEICLVVDASNLPAILLALPACPQRPTLVLREALSTRARLEQRAKVKQWLKRPVHVLGYRRTDHIIALTQHMRDELVHYWHQPQRKITVIPNGIACPDTRAEPHQRARPYILCVSRLEAQKDIPTLLNAFATVRRAHDCQLLIAGAGRDQARLEALSARLGLVADVEFLGHVSDPGALYAGAQIAVLSSLWEGFPNVVIEALAHGTPVVATRTPGAVEILDGTECGLLANLGDAPDLARQMEAALTKDWDSTTLLDRATDFSDMRLRTTVTAFFSGLCSAGDIEAASHRLAPGEPGAH